MLALMLFAPTAVADASPTLDDEGEDASVGTICIDVNVWASPPIVIYECPSGGAP